MGDPDANVRKQFDALAWAAESEHGRMLVAMLNALEADNIKLHAENDAVRRQLAEALRGRNETRSAHLALVHLVEESKRQCDNRGQISEAAKWSQIADALTEIKLLAAEHDVRVQAELQASYLEACRGLAQVHDQLSEAEHLRHRYEGLWQEAIERHGASVAEADDLRERLAEAEQRLREGAP